MASVCQHGFLIDIVYLLSTGALEDDELAFIKKIRKRLNYLEAWESLALAKLAKKYFPRLTKENLSFILRCYGDKNRIRNS